MLYAAIFLLLILIVLDRLRCLLVSTLVFRYQCQLFEIRDHLREGVVTGEVDSSYWVFQYLDSTIVRTIDALDRLTIWRIVSHALTDRDASVMRASAYLERELSKPESQYL